MKKQQQYVMQKFLNNLWGVAVWKSCEFFYFWMKAMKKQHLCLNTEVHSWPWEYVSVPNSFKLKVDLQGFYCSCWLDVADKPDTVYKLVRGAWTNT